MKLAAVKSFVSNNKSVILSVTGDILCVGGFVLGIRAGSKVDKALVARRDHIEEFKVMFENYEPEYEGDTYDEADCKKDIFKTNRKCAIDVAKNLAVPSTLEILGIVCNNMATAVEHKKFKTASNALVALGAMFAGYRKNVIRELGHDMDEHFLYGTSVEEKEVTLVSTDEDGNEVETTEKMKTLDNLFGASSFAVLWTDETSNRYNSDEYYTDEFFYNTAKYLTDTLTICDKYDVNYAKRYLGIKSKYITLNGQAWGWEKGDTVEIKRIPVAIPTGDGRFKKGCIVDFPNCHYILDKYPDTDFNSDFGDLLNGEDIQIV